jgi:FKBP-type peptidyl-prolyl cis-trans isomerase FklB
MKKTILLSISIVLIAAICTAQAGKPNRAIKPAEAKPAPPKPLLKTLKDSASYAMGIFIVNVYMQQGITDINSAMVARAIDDLQKKRPRLLQDNQANNAVLNYLNQIQQKKSKPNIEAGEKFLSANKNRPGIVTTRSGLQYEVITQGNGPLPVAGDTVVCNYVGSFINGNEFENSYKTGQPATFAVTGVISGWTEALLLMPAGSKWKLYIPYQLGYGPSDYYLIPGGSALIFELELIGIKGK